MLFRSKTYLVLGLMIMGSLILVGCGDNTATLAPATTAAAQSTNAGTSAAAATTTRAGTTAAASGTTTGATSGTTAAATTRAATAGAATTAATSGTTSANGSNTSTAACTKLNLNSLTESQLTAAIPGFPNRMVREFLEYRPYSSILQFRKEIGKYVDASQVTEWEKYVFVPVKPNDADTETLKQIPGVDNTVAAALTAGRPYASNDAFLKTLATKISAQQTASASCYLGA